jgi:hypothetical protein
MSLLEVQLLSSEAGLGKSHALMNLAREAAHRYTCLWVESSVSEAQVIRHLQALHKAKRPQCLLLDDLHLLEPKALKRLLFWLSEQRAIASDKSGGKLKLILTMRSVHLGEAQFQSLLHLVSSHTRLKTLTIRDLFLMLKSFVLEQKLRLSPERLSKLSRQLHERSKGKPFHAKRLLTLAHQQGHLRSEQAEEPFAKLAPLLEVEMETAFAQHPWAKQLMGALHLAGQELSLQLLSLLPDAPPPSKVPLLIQSWVRANLIELKTINGTIDFAHAFLRAEPLSWLSPKEQLSLLEHLLSSLQQADLGATPRAILGARLSFKELELRDEVHSNERIRTFVESLLHWIESLATRQALEDERQSAQVTSEATSLQSQAPSESFQQASTELAEFCFSLLEAPCTPASIQEVALGYLTREKANEKNRQRWLKILQSLPWSLQDDVSLRYLVSTLVPTLDHVGELGSFRKWVERLEPILQPEMLAELKLDFALNRLMRSDRKSIQAVLGTESLRPLLSTPNRLAQLDLIESFLSIDLASEAPKWLTLLEEFHKQSSSHLDPWNLDRLLLQIIDAASRARKGEALERWQKTAIQSAKAIAKHDPPAIGKARVARRLLYFGQAGDAIEDLIAAAEWQMQQGNLRMALPDLDAAATTYFKQGELEKAQQIYLDLSPLVLAQPLDRLVVGFRINACAPLLAAGHWATASAWLDGLESFIEQAPAYAPFYAYSRLQILDREAQESPLSSESLNTLEELAAQQMAISPKEGQRFAEIQALLWVNRFRSIQAGTKRHGSKDLPKPQAVQSVLSQLEKQNFAMRPEALSQLAELALGMSLGVNEKTWNPLAKLLRDRLSGFLEKLPVLVCYQLARLAHMQGDRLRVRDWALRALLQAFNSKLSAWERVLESTFPKVRLQGLVADKSRDRMSPVTRVSWLNTLEMQIGPGPRLRCMGIDLSEQEPCKTLCLQLDLITRSLPWWLRSERKAAASADVFEEYKILEQTVTQKRRSLPDLPHCLPQEKPLVAFRVSLVAGLRVYFAGQELWSKEMGRGLLKELFVFLVIEHWRHPSRAWSALDLVKELWDDEFNPEQHLNSLYVYLSQLRRILKRSGFPDCLEHTSLGYRLHRDCPIQLDLARFERAVKLARELRYLSDAKALIDLSLEVARDFGRPLLPVLSGAWLDDIRSWHELKFFDLIELTLKEANPMEAVHKQLQLALDSFYPD